MAENPRERRRYFRIDDKVQLQVRRLTDEEFQLAMNKAPDQHAGANVAAQLRNLTNQMGNTLLTIRKHNPEIAQYLQLLDKKLEILARHLDSPAEANARLQKVNIGTGGLAYWTEEALPAETKLEVQFVLFPSCLRVTALAHVVHAEEDPQGTAAQRFRIGVDFDRIGDAEQEGLARHLIELQSAQLRRQRGR
jgi:c-di-GMP-binding flagellar brake protein YcgR